jgi:hypothetical protein
MKAGEVVSLQRMKAWWAYSEIRSPHSRQYINEIRGYRRSTLR